MVSSILIHTVLEYVDNDPPGMVYEAGLAGVYQQKYLNYQNLVGTASSAVPGIPLLIYYDIQYIHSNRVHRFSGGNTMGRECWRTHLYANRIMLDNIKIPIPRVLSNIILDYMGYNARIDTSKGHLRFVNPTP